MSRRGHVKIRKEKSSPETDSNRSGSATGRRQPRASRAVRNLSTKQLERKRQNDREAQRIIRQRTKDKISQLEDQVNQLKANSGPERQLVDAMQQHLKVLEEENHRLSRDNDFLRSRLYQAGISASPAEESGSWEQMSLRLPPPSLQHGEPIPHVEAERFVGQPVEQEDTTSCGYGQAQSWPSGSSYHGESVEGRELSPAHVAWPSGASRVDTSTRIAYPPPASTQTYSVSSTPAQIHHQSQLPTRIQGVPSYGPARASYFQEAQLKMETPEPDPSQPSDSQVHHDSQQTYYRAYPPPAS